MAQYYRVYSRGAVTCRTYTELAAELPEESRVLRHLRGAPAAGEAYLADIRYLLEARLWQESGGKGPKPKHTLAPQKSDNYGGDALTPEEWKQRWREGRA